MAEFTGTKSSSTNPSGASYRSSASLPSGTSSAVENMTASLKEAYGTVQKKAQQAISSSEDFVRERPLRTVLGAAAVGFLAGYIARRKH